MIRNGAIYIKRITYRTIALDTAANSGYVYRTLQKLGYLALLL